MAVNPKHIKLYGHRGARALFPENTLIGFIEAVKAGVHALEMDVVISGDGLVVVSHEPWMNPVFCTRPDGKSVEKNSEDKYNLFEMDYEEIRTFDCGKKINPEFPLQKSFSEHKPLLGEVITAVEEYTKTNELPATDYLIEIKSEEGHDGIFNPPPLQFVQLVLNEINKFNIPKRIILQSFDARILNEIHRVSSQLKTGLLVENNDSATVNLKRLVFTPTMYNPDFNLVTPELVRELHDQEIQIIPWTVNDAAEMKKIIGFGVDGIITDDPKTAITVLNKAIS